VLKQRQGERPAGARCRSWQEAPVPAFSSPEDIARWFADKPRDVAVVLAARVALRVIPLGARTLDWDRHTNTVLRAFRCAQAAWAVAAYPGYAARLRPAAQAAASTVHGLGAPKAETATEWASAAAGAALDEDALRFAGHASTYAFSAAGGAGSQAGYDLLNSFAADADMLDQGYHPVTLATSSKLWRALPDWAHDDWEKLKIALAPDEDWDVWTDWYDARLSVRPANQVLEIMRATIPNELWQRRPRIINAHIQRLIEEPEVFADATRPDDLGPRLALLPLEELAAVGVRAGLRALPLFALGGFEPAFAGDFLLMLRAVSAAWVAARYPRRARNRALSDAANRAAMKARTVIVRAVASTLTASGVSLVSPNAVKFVAAGIDALRSTSTQSDGPAAGAAFKLALTQDLNDLRGANGAPGAAASLADLELWPGGAPPEWMAQRWSTMRRDLIGAGAGWEVWVDWYEDRLGGRVRSEAHELAYVEVPDALWKPGMVGDPAVVNTWIMSRLARLADQAEGDPPTGDIDEKAPPVIPAQRPAAIEPIWSNGRLTLPKAAAKSDLRGRALTAALKSLREELHVFADDIAGEANIDRRFVSHVRTLAEQIPHKSPRQAELFRLGHAGDVFAGYASVVEVEWPEILAIRFHALALHFDRIMRQSPLWREFKRNASQERLTAEQVEAAASLAATVATALRDDDATAFIDPAIPGALERLAEPLHATEDASRNIIEAGQDELAFDVVESTSNILKRISEEALAFKTGAGAVARDAGSTLRDASGEYARGIGKGIKRAAKREGPKDGEKLFKWLRRAVLVAGGYGVSSALGLPQLIAAYPQAFAWLERLVGFIR
jgi:hypothetical protein